MLALACLALLHALLLHALEHAPLPPPPPPPESRWNTFVLSVWLPKAMGGSFMGGAGGGGGGASDGRPAFCQVKSGPLCCWQWGSKYNT